MDYDFLVLGSGIAGLTFALQVAPHGRVGIITKKHRSESNTNYAQGGIAAAIGQDDDWQLHYEDTLTAGAGLCDPKAVRILTQNGPRLIQWLLQWGADFDMKDNQLALGREGGHRRHRIVHSADHTGSEIEHTLLRAIRGLPQITLLEHYFALDLLIQNGSCTGARVLETVTGDVLEIRARATLLATGGCGQVYQHTTNPIIATGDGFGMAWRAGATIANMEFIQFHPTSLYHPEGDSFLISEAARGEGAILKRSDGYRFMPDYDPLAELAPRDIVARAIDAELKKTGDPCVFLDITHQPADYLRARFPTIYERCLQRGIDITREPIPVVPAAHYACGGVLTDLAGCTSIPGLYACGEVACTGVHGANRLASNSLLEALVFGERAAKHSIEGGGSGEWGGPERESLAWETGNPGDWEREQTRPVPSSTGPLLPHSLKVSLRQLMSREVGIVRTVARLQDALRCLEAIREQADGLLAEQPPTVEGWELKNLICTASLIVRCALFRKESRGLHYVLDYPARDDEHYRQPTIIRARSSD